jgi:hypothetical protein
VRAVAVSPDLLEQLAREERQPGSEHGSPAFLVRSTDVEAAATALHAASLRFISLDEEGEELEEWSDTGETYTPNWVSDIYLSPDGPWLSTDTQGVLFPRMIRAMIDVLVEELQGRGVDARIEAPAPGLSSDEAWQAPAPPQGVAEPDGPRAWVIKRGVRRVTTSGRMWWDEEYFCNDGRWTRDCRQALMFPDMPPTDWVAAIIADHPADADTERRFGSIMSVYSRVDGYERPGAKPPTELRRDD